MECLKTNYPHILASPEGSPQNQDTNICFNLKTFQHIYFQECVYPYLHAHWEYVGGGWEYAGSMLRAIV